MRPFIFLIATLLLTGGQSALCLAQQPSGPRTLENLLNSGEVQKPAAAAAPVADATDAGPKRPAGTSARPKNGVQHPDLDKAWADYDAAVGKVAESIKAAINKQFDAAAAKGDLDAVEKWQAALEKFEKAGELPAEKEAKAAVGAAVADYKKAREELAAAYEAVVKSLTMEKRIEDAKAARNESQNLAKQSVAARECVVTIRLTSDWGSVTLHPAAAVEIDKQEVIRGGQQWKVTDNKIELHGQSFRHNDSIVRIMCRLKGPQQELIFETHKGDIGGLYVEAVSGGRVIGQYQNEGSHGGNAQRSDACRQDFKAVLP